MLFVFQKVFIIYHTLCVGLGDIKITQVIFVPQKN